MSSPAAGKTRMRKRSNRNPRRSHRQPCPCKMQRRRLKKVFVLRNRRQSQQYRRFRWTRPMHMGHGFFIEMHEAFFGGQVKTRHFGFLRLNCTPNDLAGPAKRRTGRRLNNAPMDKSGSICLEQPRRTRRKIRALRRMYSLVLTIRHGNQRLQEHRWPQGRMTCPMRQAERMVHFRSIALQMPSK